MKGVSLLPSRAGRTLNSACLTGGCGGQLLRGMPAVATGCCHGRGRRGEACMSLPQACNGDGRGRIVRPVRAAEGRRTACPRPRLANWKAGRPADGLSTHVGPLFGPPRTCLRGLESQRRAAFSPRRRALPSPLGAQLQF